MIAQELAGQRQQMTAMEQAIRQAAQATQAGQNPGAQQQYPIIVPGLERILQEMRDASSGPSSVPPARRGQKKRQYARPVRQCAANRADASHHVVPPHSTDASAHSTSTSTSAIASAGTVAGSNRHGHRGGTKESEHTRDLDEKPPREERRHITRAGPAREGKPSGLAGTNTRGIIVRAIATATTDGGSDSHGHGGGTETLKLAKRTVE